jgi:NOL1/NOP2/fmu family ribosome biogenesis protein
MQQLIILNNKEVKPFKEMLVKQFGYSLSEDYAYLKTSKDKIYIINKDIARVNINNLIIDKVGLYFGEVNQTEFRLSKEGAQLLGLEAKKHKVELKNVVELTNEEMESYFASVDLIKDLGSDNKMILLKYKDDVFGCAKYKQGKILNFLPKVHRVEVIL